jgi:beta-lactamase class A
MPEDENELQARVQSIAAEAGGLVAVAARDLTRGRRFDAHADERFPAASVIKICILVELLARAHEGDLDLEERLSVRAEEKMPGSGVLNMLRDGLDLSLLDLAHLMINVSDNTASNMLIDRLGCDQINARMQALG